MDDDSTPRHGLQKEKEEEKEEKKKEEEEEEAADVTRTDAHSPTVFSAAMANY